MTWLRWKLSICILATVACLGVQCHMELFLTGHLEHCFEDRLDGAASQNKLHYRFEIVNPQPSETVTAKITAPSGKRVKLWRGVSEGSLHQNIAETGLYSFCFTRKHSSRVDFSVLVDFHSSGYATTLLRLFATHDFGVSKTKPDETVNQLSPLFTVIGTQDVGIVRFDLYDVSKAIIKDETRAYLVLTIDTPSSKPSDGRMHVLEEPEFRAEVTWKAHERILNALADTRPTFEWQVAKEGRVQIDVTQSFQRAMELGHRGISFIISSSSMSPVTYCSTRNSPADYWPTLLIEDMPDSLMESVSRFSEKVWLLRSEIAYLQHHGIETAQTVESTKSRVSWLTFFMIVIVVAISVGQVYFIQFLVNSSNK